MPPSAQEKAARLLTKKHDDSSRARSTTHSRSRRWLQGARRLLFSGHYVLNILLVSTYLLLRWRYSSVPLRELQIVQNMLHGSSAADWASWERLAGAGCGTGALRAIMRARSMDGGAAATLRYAQVHVLVMSLLAHRVAFAYYALAFLLLFLAFSQPEHSGRDDRVQLHPERLAEYLRLQLSSPAPPASSAPPPPAASAAPPTPTTATAVTSTAAAVAAPVPPFPAAVDPNLPTVSVPSLVVTFHVPWHAGCRQMSTQLVELANEYSTPRLQFGHLDVAEWPALAQQYGIDTGVDTQQLPTVVLFEKGVEVLRLPRRPLSAAAAKKALAGGEFRGRDVVREFELDARSGRAGAGPVVGPAAAAAAAAAGVKGTAGAKAARAGR